MKLFIAEKPSLARAIAAGIGVGKNFDGYISLNGWNEIVTWFYGHILENFSPDAYDENYKKWRLEDLPIVPDIWKLKINSDTSKPFKIIPDIPDFIACYQNAPSFDGIHELRFSLDNFFILC